MLGSAAVAIWVAVAVVTPRFGSQGYLGDLQLILEVDSFDAPFHRVTPATVICSVTPDFSWRC